MFMKSLKQCPVGLHVLSGSSPSESSLGKGRAFSVVTEEAECEVPRSLLSLLGRGRPMGSCRGKLRFPAQGWIHIRV